MRLIFVTGTDTSVGKTVLTALLLCHLRQTGHCAVALKPFCSGSRADARLLHSLQSSNGNSEIKNRKSKNKNRLTLDDINPFHFPESLAPLVAARKHRRKITLPKVLKHIRSIAASLVNRTIHLSTSPTLLIEGAGGLLAPLAENFNLLNLITQLAPIGTSSSHEPSSITHHPPSTPPTVLIVAPNRLGTLNHCLLTVRALQAAGHKQLAVVLMGQRKPDPSAVSNPKILSELLAPVPVHILPFLGRHCCSPAVLQRNILKLAPSLTAMLP